MRTWPGAASGSGTSLLTTASGPARAVMTAARTRFLRGGRSRMMSVEEVTHPPAGGALVAEAAGDDRDQGPAPGLAHHVAEVAPEEPTSAPAMISRSGPDEQAPRAPTPTASGESAARTRRLRSSGSGVGDERRRRRGTTTAAWPRSRMLVPRRTPTWPSASPTSARSGWASPPAPWTTSAAAGPPHDWRHPGPGLLRNRGCRPGTASRTGRPRSSPAGGPAGRRPPMGRVAVSLTPRRHSPPPSRADP